VPGLFLPSPSMWFHMSLLFMNEVLLLVGVFCMFMAYIHLVDMVLGTCNYQLVKAPVLRWKSRS
jgi:hypothetical protein